MIQVNAVTCIRQNRCLFENLSFSVSAGQILQIEGVNGAGKTSLLKILTGLLLPHEGTVDYVDDTSDILYIGHKSGVASSLSPIENHKWWNDTNDLVEVDPYNIFAELGLVGLEEYPAIYLSAGQQRRIALSRLWYTEKRLWILDEPFTALDKHGVLLLQDKFQQHLNGGGAIILTTHQDMTKQFENLRTLELEYRI